MSVVRVLCVENHQEHLDALLYMLKAAGYEVVSATTAAQAMNLFIKQNVQGVLMEYDLPDVTGSAVRAEMKRLRPEISVLLFTGICLLESDARRLSCCAFSIRISALRADRSGRFVIWTRRRERLMYSRRMDEAISKKQQPSNVQGPAAVFVAQCEENNDGADGY